MKIAHITNRFYPCIGGIETFTLDLCKELSKNQIECKVICLNKCANSSQKLEHYAKLSNMEIIRIPFFDLKYYKIAPSVLSHIKDCDLLHIHGIGFFSDFLLMTKFLHHKPIIVQSHGGIFHTKKLGFLKNIYFNFFEKFLFNFADIVVVDSLQDFELFKKISADSKLIHIENAISLDDFSNIKIGKEKNSFLFVGRISANKRVDLLVKTFAFLSKLMPDAKLHIIGTDFDNCLQKCKELVTGSNIQKNVIFVGELQREKLLEYYSKAEYIISASSYEGFGISIVEGMASGCIPLLSDISQFREFAKDFGNEFIIDFENPEKAANQILGISRQDKKRLSEISRHSAERYSWKNRINEFVKLYSGFAKK
ncbi:MAG: glycosyltransferase family 4 protein [archaeon]